MQHKLVKTGKDRLLTGFTLIEIIIAIFVLSIAIIGIFSAFSVIIILTSDSADRLTATYLAQEGTEIARNIRDTNWLKMDANWLNHLDDCAQGCEANYTKGTDASIVMSPWPGEGRYLYINTDGFYDYNEAGSGTKTGYKRKIIITPLSDIGGSSDNIIKIGVEVSWNKKATILNAGLTAGNCDPNNCVVSEVVLYNWY